MAIAVLYFNLLGLKDDPKSLGLKFDNVDEMYNWPMNLNSLRCQPVRQLDAEKAG